MVIVWQIICRHTYRNDLPVGALPHGAVIATCTKCGKVAVR